MENFGIMLSLPVAYVANALYCWFLIGVISRYRLISSWFRAISFIVLGLFVVEIALLFTLGAVKSQAILGSSFYTTHLILFFLCPPALANILILRQKTDIFKRWWAAAMIVALFAFCLVLLQYSVSESLFGIDGENGPYSPRSSQHHPPSLFTARSCRLPV